MVTDITPNFAAAPSKYLSAEYYSFGKTEDVFFDAPSNVEAVYEVYGGNSYTGVPAIYTTVLGKVSWYGAYELPMIEPSTGGRIDITWEGTFRTLSTPYNDELDESMNGQSGWGFFTLVALAGSTLTFTDNYTAVGTGIDHGTSVLSMSVANSSSPRLFIVPRGYVRSTGFVNAPNPATNYVKVDQVGVSVNITLHDAEAIEPVEPEIILPEVPGGGWAIGMVN